MANKIIFLLNVFLEEMSWTAKCSTSCCHLVPDCSISYSTALAHGTECSNRLLQTLSSLWAAHMVEHTDTNRAFIDRHLSLKLLQFVWRGSLHQTSVYWNGNALCKRPFNVHFCHAIWRHRVHFSMSKITMCIAILNLILIIFITNQDQDVLNCI